MKIKKDLIIAVLATFCLTATLFTILPSSSQTGSEYDPFADVDCNGVVDIFDAILLANAFGTSGTPIDKSQWVTGTVSAPAYDSGWVAGNYTTRFVHNLGTTNVTIDVMLYTPLSDNEVDKGIMSKDLSWYNLTSTDVFVLDAYSATGPPHYLRVMMWIIAEP